MRESPQGFKSYLLEDTMQRLRSSLCFSSSTLTYTYRTLRYNHHDRDCLSPMASQLRSRSVVRFSGPDTVKFLHGLLTNDVRRFASAHEVSPLYAALLTPQGRFLYDLFLYKPPSIEEKLNDTVSGSRLNRGGEFQLFADVDSDVFDELIQTFKRYRLRSKVDIDSVAEELSCWQLYGGNLSNSSSPEDHRWRWFKDPRLDFLGYRGIFPSNTEPPLVEADKETEEANYLQWRFDNGVAEGSTEMPKGEAIPLEYNLEGLNAISFDKGCYVGQELIARTHHRGVIRKRLMPLKFLENGGEGISVDQKVGPGSEVIDGGNGKKVGVVTAALACRGLGLLRLEDTFEGAESLTIKGQDGVKVEAIKPNWWPPEWF